MPTSLHRVLSWLTCGREKSWGGVLFILIYLNRCSVCILHANRKGLHSGRDALLTPSCDPRDAEEVKDIDMEVRHRSLTVINLLAKLEI